MTPRFLLTTILSNDPAQRTGKLLRRLLNKFCFDLVDPPRGGRLQHDFVLRSISCIVMRTVVQDRNDCAGELFFVSVARTDKHGCRGRVGGKWQHIANDALSGVHEQFVLASANLPRG